MVPTIGGGTQDTDFNIGLTKGIFTFFFDGLSDNRLNNTFFPHFYTVRFPKHLGLDAVSASWDLKFRIPRRKLRI